MMGPLLHSWQTSLRHVVWLMLRQLTRMLRIVIVQDVRATSDAVVHLKPGSKLRRDDS